MSFGMFEAAVAGDKENEHQKKLAKTRLAQAAAEVDQKLGSFLSKATSKSDYIERVRLAENDFREIVGKYLEGDTGFKAVATKMADHYVRKVAFTDIKDIRSHVDGLGVKTRKKGDGFTFPAASGATGYIAVRPNGEIVVETLIGRSGGFQSVYAPNEMDLVERWIEKTVGGSYRMSSRRHASSVYELAGELASQTGRSEQEMEEALILYLEQMESLDGVSYDEDNLPSEARDFLTEAVIHGIAAGDFRSAKVRRPSRRRALRRRANGETYRFHDIGVVEVFDADAYLSEHPDADIVTDYDGRMWDESVVPFRPPAPAARTASRRARRRVATSLYDLASEVAQKTGISEEEAESALENYLTQAEKIDGTSYDEDNLPDDVADFLAESVVQGVSAGDFRNSSRKRRSSRRRVALLPDEFNVDVDSAMAYDAEAGMFVDVQPGGNGYEWNLYWDSGSDYTNVTQDLADSGSAGSLEEAIEQAAHEVSQYSPDSNPFRQSARKRRSNRRTARGVDFSRSTYDLFEDGSGDSWYDLVDTEENSYDSDDLDEVVHWLKQDGLLPYDGRMDTYTSDTYEDPYGSQRYEDSAALRGFTDEELHEIKRRMSNRRTARGVDFTRATYDLFEDGSGDSWYDLVDEDSRSYDSDDLDEVATWLKQDGLYPYDGRHDLYVADSYEDPYTSQRYEDSAALRGFSDDELHEIKRRMSSRRASRGRRPFDRVAGERPSMDEEVDWLNNANSGTTIQAWDPRGGEETEDGDYTGEYIKFVKTKGGNWYNNDYRTSLSPEELAGNEVEFKRSHRR